MLGLDPFEIPVERVVLRVRDRRRVLDVIGDACVPDPLGQLGVPFLEFLVRDLPVVLFGGLLCSLFFSATHGRPLFRTIRVLAPFASSVASPSAQALIR